MQFLVVGLDGTDEHAPARRQAARPDHLELGNQLLSDGNLWYAAALTDDNGAMTGSMYMVDFATRADLDDWLAQEPYVVGGVWKQIEVRPCITRDPWQFNRPQQFFMDRP